eukprot:TRINITY_DN45289_c0_g1_i1.p1 TRINITY_DN45289_c0_g1~~TRINITY_DN45289_c0_g1_i1.p1  ORF type:complete len:334 (-),score=40.16 TRINITY_DN45289_c0_g1_i1:1059-2060(-)
MSGSSMILGRRGLFTPAPLVLHRRGGKVGTGKTTKFFPSATPQRLTISSGQMRNSYMSSTNLFSDTYVRKIGALLPRYRMPFGTKPHAYHQMQRIGDRYSTRGSQDHLHRINAVKSHPAYRAHVDGNAVSYRFFSSRSHPPPVYTNPYDTGYDYSFHGATPLTQLAPHLEPADGTADLPYSDETVGAAFDAMARAGAQTLEEAALQPDEWWMTLRVPPGLLHSIRFLVGETYAQHQTRCKWMRIALRGMPFTPISGGNAVVACPPPRKEWDMHRALEVRNRVRPLYEEGAEHTSSLIRNFSPNVIGNSWDTMQSYSQHVMDLWPGDRQSKWQY